MVTRGSERVKVISNTFFKFTWNNKEIIQIK